MPDFPGGLLPGTGPFAFKDRVTPLLELTMKLMIISQVRSGSFVKCSDYFVVPVKLAAGFPIWKQIAKLVNIHRELLPF